jgi:general stress protein CsbA
MFLSTLQISIQKLKKNDYVKIVLSFFLLTNSYSKSYFYIFSCRLFRLKIEDRVNLIQ